MHLGLVSFVKLLFFLCQSPLLNPYPLQIFTPLHLSLFLLEFFFSVLVFGNVFLPQMTDAVIYFVGRAVNVPELNEMEHIWTAALLALTISSDKTVQHCKLNTTQRGT